MESNLESTSLKEVIDNLESKKPPETNASVKQKPALKKQSVIYKKTEVSNWDRFYLAKQILLGIFVLAMIFTIIGCFHPIGFELLKTILLPIAMLIIGYYFGANSANDS